LPPIHSLYNQSDINTTQDGLGCTFFLASPASLQLGAQPEILSNTDKRLAFLLLSSLSLRNTRRLNSLAPQIKSFSPSLFKALKPVAEFYARAAGHRSMGLKWDDLLMEEREDVQKVSPEAYHPRNSRLGLHGR
jgi:hypothetical protein